jgi:WD40 repeat protein
MGCQCFDLAFAGDGRVLVSAGGDGTVRVWDPIKAEKIREFLVQRPGHALSVATSTARQLIAAGTDKSTVKLWRMADGGEVSSAIPQDWGAVHDLAFKDDGRLLAVAAGKEEIHVWNLADNAPLAAPSVGHGQVDRCAFTPEGKYLVVGNQDGSVVVLDAKTWSPIGSGSHSRRRAVTDLSVDGQGSYIASSDDTEILLWQINPFQRTGKPMQPGGSRVSAIALSPDGRVLAAGLGSGTLILWRTDTGDQLGTPLEGHKEFYIGSVAFSPNGKMLASGGGDGTIIVWNIGSE